MKMSNKKYFFKNSTSGQMVVEAILLVVVFFGVLQIVSQYFQNNQLVQKFVEVPYRKVKGMAQNGTWLTDATPGTGSGGQNQTDTTSIINHPMHLKRHVSLEGDPIQ